MLGAETDHSGDGVRGHSVLQLVSQLPGEIVTNQRLVSRSRDQYWPIRGQHSPGEVVVNVAAVMTEDKVAIIAQTDDISWLVNSVQVINEGSLHAAVAKPEQILKLIKAYRAVFE